MCRRKSERLIFIRNAYGITNALNGKKLSLFSMLLYSAQSGFVLNTTGGPRWEITVLLTVFSMKTPQKQIEPFDGLWRVNLSFAYWNVKLYKVMVQQRGRERKIARGNSVSCFSGVYFPNQIESECSDWSWPVQRKVRNLTFTVELDRLRVIRTNFFLLKNITYLKFKRFQSIRQTRGS